MQVPTRGQLARLALATPDGANNRIITTESTCTGLGNTCRSLPAASGAVVCQNQRIVQSNTHAAICAGQSAAEALAQHACFRCTERALQTEQDGI